MKTPLRQRTCRACRKKEDKKELLRLVVIDKKTLEVDPKQIMPGRGWYLCRGDACLSCLKVLKGRQKAFGRDFTIGPGLNHLILNPPAGGVHGQS
jgi:predicted RNA-binding protein YlxR (DUF448 family)